MARKSQKTINNEVVMRARDCFEEAYSADREQRELAVEDLLFAQVEGHQWGEDDGSDRPRYEINHLGAKINQVSGEWRNSQVRIKVRPVSGNASGDVASVMAGVIRDIENQSSAKGIYNTAFDTLVNSGFTAWRIITEQSKDDPFDNNQDIKIKAIRNALTSVWFDPLAKDSHKRDARYALVMNEMSRDDFAEKYPNSVLSDFSTPVSSLCDKYGDWVSSETVKIAELWERVPTMRQMVRMSDGRIVWRDSIESIIDELANGGVFIVDTADVESHKVQMHIVSGAEVLSGPHEWAGCQIPIIPVYGFNFWVKNNHYYHGLVRPGKDAQMAYNWATSASIEAVSRAPDDPYWMTVEQALGHETRLERMKIDSSPIQFYNPDPKAPGAPQRTGAPQVNQALVLVQQQAERDLQTVLGRTGLNVQDDANAESGRAVLARQKQQDLGTAILFSNMQSGIQYTAEILLDLIPKIIDTERARRILNEDGSSEVVRLNQFVVDQQTGRKVLVNDLSVGRYDVLSDVAPSFASQRSESVAFLTQLAQSNPEFQMISADLIAKNADFADAAELQKRLRKMQLQKGVIEPNEEEAKELAAKQPQQPDPLTMLQLQALQENIRNVAAQTELTQAQAVKAMSDANKSAADAEKTVAEMAKTLADTQKTLQEINNLKAQMLEILSSAVATASNAAVRNDGGAVIVASEPAKIAGEISEKSEEFIEKTDIE